MVDEQVKQDDFKDKKGAEIKAGALVLIPFRVIKLGGSRSPLLQLETVEAYGHANAADKTPLKGRTRTAFWAEPEQVELAPSS